MHFLNLLFEDVTIVPELFAVCLGFVWDRVNLLSVAGTVLWFLGLEWE